MGFSEFICVLIAVIVAFSHVAICEPKVKMLHVVFRHGEKVPHAQYQGYPNDPHKDHSYYPIASGGLTNKGKLSEYKIGKMLRDRYDDFFTPLYSPDEIDARSSDIPRAQMSLQLVLAALFPPAEEQIWNPNLAWQPVATVFEANAKDYLFFPEHCPLYKVEYRNYLERDDIRRQIDEHKGTFEYLTNYTGKKIDTPDAVYYLYNLFREESMQGLELPEWTKRVYPEPMKNITILRFNLRSGSTKLKRLGGGIMLRKITDDMKSLCGKTLCPENRKAFLFSGHEDNVARLVRTLGTNDPVLPDYGSTIIFETLQDNGTNNAYFVRVLLWPGSSNEQLIVQKIPGCDELCPLEKFLGLLNDVIPDEYEKQCCVKSKNSKKAAVVNLSSKNAVSIMACVPIIISLYTGLHKYEF